MDEEPWKDRLIGDVAERQHGVIARRQLEAMGLGRGAIDHRRLCGRLKTVHRGVYAVGHARLSPRGRAMAAVLACWPGAVLSHRAAAWLWGIGLLPPRMEVARPTWRASRPAIEVHVAPLPPDEVAHIDGIPLTGVSRTIFDLAATQPLRRIERAMREAEYRRLTDPLSLSALLTRYPRRPGAKIIKAILEDAQPAHLTRSDLEDRFHEFMRATGLPTPSSNMSVEGYEVDAVWWDRKLIIELDGRSEHQTDAAFEEDRERDRRLQAAGWRVVRVTGRQLTRQASQLERDLRLLYAGSSRPSQPR